MNELNKEVLEFNAKLQQKKNKLRKALKEKGVLKNKGKNDYDKYQYFSESQYKELFTELFSEHGLELSFNEIDYIPFEASGAMSNGRCVKIEFTLTDIETGWDETSIITGEGMDKGDKAGYKAYTGALKYYLANTFMVATGDDAEKESPSEPMSKTARPASEKQIALLKKYYTGESLDMLLQANKISKIEELPITKASELIGAIKEKENGNN